MLKEIENSLLRLEGLLVNCLDSEGLDELTNVLGRIIDIINSGDNTEVANLLATLNKNTDNVNYFLMAMDSPAAEEAFLKVLRNGIFTV